MLLLDYKVLIAAFVGSLLLTPVIRRFAIRRCLVDIPNARSSHACPTPRGGGLAIVTCYLISLVAMVLLNYVSISVALAFAGAGFLVAAISFWDDHAHVRPRWRIAVHIIAALWAWYFIVDLSAIPHQSIAWWLFNIYLIVSVVWVINLYNFMDGIDAIAGSETVFIGACATLFFWMSDASQFALLAALLTASTAGFLVWNFPPASIFMGDVGSSYLGLAIGLLALAGIASGTVNIWTWLILLGVFLTDATLTVGRRMALGLKWYEAHRSHAYQHAAQRSGSHGKVIAVIAGINLFWLFPLAFAAYRWSEYGFVFALIAYSPLVWIALRLRAGLDDKESVSTMSQSDGKIDLKGVSKQWS